MTLVAAQRLMRVKASKTTDPARTGPLGPGTVLRQPLPCSPCLQRRCRIADTYRCMRDLDVEAVARAARELLALRAGEK